MIAATFTQTTPLKRDLPTNDLKEPNHFRIIVSQLKMNKCVNQASYTNIGPEIETHSTAYRAQPPIGMDLEAFWASGVFFIRLQSRMNAIGAPKNDWIGRDPKWFHL